MANRQTKATEKWQKEAGYMVKGFKLKRDIVTQFEQVCLEKDVSQASVISQFMESYVKFHNEEKGES